MKKLIILPLLLLSIISCKSDDEPIDNSENEEVLPPIEDLIEEEVPEPTAELLLNLSELHLFQGDLKDLTPTEYLEVYNLQTPLFTDYCHKKRFIYIPEGTSMEYTGEGFPNYPENTILAKTFYYNKDENDLSKGKIIIETRVLIKKAGVWEIGNYIWNEDQTDAIRDEAGVEQIITWLDANGEEKTVDYKVPNYETCVMCHSNNGVRTPIGPKIRNMNVDNQLRHFMDKGILTGIDDLSSVEKLPNWENTSESLDNRARAYLDVNCAHCHQPKGYYDNNFTADFEFRYETKFSDTHIYQKRDAMLTRIESNIEGYRMPYVGTSIKHEEGVSLLEEYLNSL